MSALIKAAIPEAMEAWRRRGVPVWYRYGMICSGESDESVVKLAFAEGAALDDPVRRFDAGLDGDVRRAIDIRGREAVDEDALGFAPRGRRGPEPVFGPIVAP